MFAIRDVKPDDLVHLRDCDIKCFDYGWDDEEWSHVFKTHVVRIAHCYGTPIGFVVFVLMAEGPPAVQILKLGVKPNFRRRRVSLMLLRAVMGFAMSAGLHEIESVVPEMMCRPGEPRDITGWLAKVGFKGTGVIRNYIQNMGTVEDGYKFQLRF